MPNSSPPKYTQVYRHVVSLVESWPAESEQPLPTDKSLAEQFGVSRITVTRAMQKLVDEGRVQRIRGKGSFVRPQTAPPPNRSNINTHSIAQSLVVVILPFSNQLASDLLVGVEREARQHNRLVVLQHSDDSWQRERQLLNQALANPLVKGVILYPISASQNIDVLGRFLVSKTPLVLLDRDVSGLSLPTVAVDNYRAFSHLTAYLLDQGHRFISFVATQNFHLTSEQRRFRGFCDAYFQRSLSLPEQPLRHLNTDRPESAQALLKQVIDDDLASRTTALACVNDDAASLLIRQCNALGITLPDTLSITGFDDLEFANHLTPTLTTVKQPGQALGQQAMSVIERDSTAPLNTETLLVQAQLIARQSVSKR